CLDGLRIANQDQAGDSRQLLQGEGCTGDIVLGRKIAAHCIESDFHEREQDRAASLSMEMKQPPARTAGRLNKSSVLLDCFYGEDLPATVVAAGRACAMSADAAAALRAALELASMPAVSGLAGPQAHLRGLSLGNSHGR